jgi:hypothetical protein
MYVRTSLQQHNGEYVYIPCTQITGVVCSNLKQPFPVCGNLKKIALIYCNTMLIASTKTQKEEIVCEDINDFIKYDRHYSRLVNKALLDEQIQTKQ